jgi:hypothetical protein
MTQNGTANGAVRPARFASGAAVKLPLSDGDWVLVRAELSYGQQRRLAMAGVTGMPPALAGAAGEGRLSVDWAAFEIERLVTWVMDWSFRDGDGDRVVVSREAIESLHPETAQEIAAALDAHVEALEAKKAPGAGGTPNSAATSPSAKRSAGAGTS